VVFVLFDFKTKFVFEPFLRSLSVRYKYG
jgi:hypothetical protein